MTPKKTEKEIAEAKILRKEKMAKNFIIKSKEIHRDNDGNPLYDYDESIYVKSAEKLIIICKKHGKFKQSPNSHLSGHGCPKCRDDLNKELQTMTQEEFIKRCNEQHPNLLDYSKCVYINRITPTTFICKQCSNEFTRDPGHMLGDGRGHGCSICNGGVKDTKETFIIKANRTHNNKYKYDLVDYINTFTYVKIICETGHIFEQTPSHHINGNGCPKCAHRGYSFEDFKKQSQKKFGENAFNYSKTNFIDMSTKIILICENNHEFNVKPGIHLKKNSLGGCWECSKIRSRGLRLYTQDYWIELASLIHNNFYNYEKVIYNSSQKNVIIICPKHGEFEQLATSHLGGSGCRSCGFEKIVESKLYKKEDFVKMIEECSKVHSNRYIYTDVFRKDGHLFMEITCDKHGKFNQRYDHHKRGHGCFKCTVLCSKPQLEWLNYLSVSTDYIQHALNDGEYQIPNTIMYADGYEPTTNSIYEFQGDFWHGNPKVFNPDDINPRTGTSYSHLYKKTQNKITKLKELGYNVYEMWESDWDKGKNAVITLQHLWKKAFISNSIRPETHEAGGDAYI